MSQTLMTGASGLLAHQRKLDVVANNLANLNTTGYKSQRILFSDLLYSSVNPATGATDKVGGTNPRQLGFGVNVAQISSNFNQGVLTSSGNEFDFAIQGDGFFVVSDGQMNYTRAGAFSLDSQGYLVDPATGARVQRFGPLGEGLDGNPGFQTAGDNGIKIPLGAGIAGRKTENAAFVGNFPATAVPPKAHRSGTSGPFLEGASPATTATLLNDLDTSDIPYGTGDSVILKGANVDGSAIDTTLSVDATTTLGDIVNFYNSVLSGAVASLNAEGKIIVQADDVGPTPLYLEMSDDLSNTGSIDFGDHSFVDEVVGKNGDVSSTTLQIFDTRGEPHTINVEFTKVDANNWDADFQLLGGSNDTLLDSQIRRIEFDEQGNFKGSSATGVGDPKIVLSFEQLIDDQVIEIEMGGLTHFATNFAAAFEQDGYSPGNLVSVSSNSEGQLEAIANNGVRVPVAQLAIANFINVGGLEAQGQNYFRESANSGFAQVGAGLDGANGYVRSGQLESSNVDVALEFTQLIVAQRGFSANARTITVASEVLSELANIIR